jgi:hypothetical protein
MTLRDRFFALSTVPRDEAAIAAYQQDIDAIDSPPVAVIDGLGVMWHPTRTRKALRFVEATVLDDSVRHLFACPSVQAPHLAAVFADPRELSFRSFENIVPLDRLFQTPELELGARKKLADKVYAFAVEPAQATRAQLDRLDGLGLYVPPLNAGQRGGERFIFHSASLAEALTQAMKKAMPKSLLGGFSHVNPVFRCNRFEPGDASFHRHRDTPYFDAARDHVSKYTVLIYLTGGSAEPALDVVGEAQLAAIPAYTCVVLDQALEHEGAPFVDGRKVFLRTELVFVDRTISHDPAIAAQFTKACYWTGESVFATELAAYADRYYNQVADAHWHGLTDATSEPFAHKQYRGVHFVANGYDFWFDARVPLAEAAAITLLDYFNCTIDHTGFRSLCTTTVVTKPDAAWIPAFLADQQASSAISAFDKAMLFPQPEETDEQCCPFHCQSWDATRSSEVVDLYTRAQTFAKNHIEPAPIVMLGQEVALDPDKFVIESDRIHVIGKAPLAPINFAACWNYGGSPGFYVDVEAKVGIVQLLVPPILWAKSRGCYHLRFDFFRNSWMVQHQQAVVPVPKIRELNDDMGDVDTLEGAEATPWVHAVDPNLISGRGTPTQLWWAESSPLLEELFGDREDLDD